HGDAGAADLAHARVGDRVVLPRRHEPGAASGRRGLDHRLGAGDAGVVPAQVVLDQWQVVPECRQRLRVLGGGAESDGQVLVDVRVDGEYGCARTGQVRREQTAQRRLAAATLADEGDLHG